MDQELVAFLDERFREFRQDLREEISGQIQQLHEETSSQIGTLREELAGQIQNLRDETSGQIGSLRQEMSAQIGSLREETSSHIGSLRQEMSQGFEQMRTEIRHVHVEIEDMHGTIRLLAEGIVSTNEMQASFEEKFEHGIQEVRALIRPVYSDLNQRVRGLETWKDLKERDPVDIIKEKFGLGGARPSSKE